jgi:hypothetical protein
VPSAAFWGKSDNERVAVLFRHEYGNDDHLPQSSQARELARDHFLVGCLLRLLADPQLERSGSFRFPVLLRPLHDADCQPDFLGWSRRRPWGTIRGIGTTGPPIRLGARPEITLLELSRT